MNPSKFACLILAMVFTVLSAYPSYAQNARNGTAAVGSAFVSKPQTGSGVVKGAGMVAPIEPAAGTTTAAAPVLQGASCGTIGPIGTDAVASPAIITPISAVSQPHQLPPIPTLLFFTLTLTAAAWGLQDIAKKRRVSIINAGVLVGAIVLALGFTWNLFNQEEEHYSHFSLGIEAMQTFAYAIHE